VAVEVEAIMARRELAVVTGQGRVLRFDGTRGYGFVAPDAGGEDIFVHANSVEGDQRLASGDWVEYDAVEGERGLKSIRVRLLRPAAGETPADRRSGREPRDGSGSGEEEDGYVDVMPEREFLAAVTETLLGGVPDLTAAQLVQVRRHMLALAQAHAWVDQD
jgi:cold shock CspA family protein